MPPGAAPGAPGRGSFTGVPLTVLRGPTTRDALTIDWVYPVYQPDSMIPESGSYSAPIRVALERAKAFQLLRDGDPRPLLILREFRTFDDPDNERLSRQLYTESAVILSYWFRCIRLPHHVEEADHPFHELFAWPRAPQLFLAAADGEAVWPFDHGSSRADLAELMLDVLETTYACRPEKNCEQLVKLLPRFDQLDAEIRRLKEELDKVIEDSGPRSVRVRKVQKDLDKAEAERQALLDRQRQLQDIPRKNG